MEVGSGVKEASVEPLLVAALVEGEYVMARRETLGDMTGYEPDVLQQLGADAEHVAQRPSRLLQTQRTHNRRRGHPLDINNGTL